MSITVNTILPDTSINKEDMEDLCRFASFSDFTEKCSWFTYSQVCQIYEDLKARESVISHQLTDRGESYDYQWKVKANSALSITRNKIKIVSHRINAMRDNHISVLLNDIGGSGWIKDKRLVMIKCLIHMIEHYCNIRSMSTEEKSVLDAARLIGDLWKDPKFDTLSYNPVTQIITDKNDQEIAKILVSGFMSDEYGYVTSHSVQMSNLLARSEVMLEYLINSYQCKIGEEHNESRCIHCLADKLHMDVVEVLTEIK